MNMKTVGFRLTDLALLETGPSGRASTIVAYGIFCKTSLVMKLLSPEEIYFSHDSISCHFKCGRHIEDTYQELLDGYTDVSIIPRMTVTYVDGEWFAWDGNRRLYVFKKLAMAGKLNWIEVNVTDERMPRSRFTTQFRGRCIEVRNRSDLNLSSLRGPSFLARFEDEPIRQSFLDSAIAGTIRSLALSYDASGYFYITNGGQWTYRGIHAMPSSLHDLIRKKASDSVDPSYVALGRGERYLVKFDDGYIAWEADCRAFTRALKSLGSWNTVNAVAFAPAGWWMSTSKGSEWHGLPLDLEETLLEADCSAKFVSISEKGDEWFVEFEDRACWYLLDRSASNVLKEHSWRGCRLTFGSQDDNVLELY
eukprot:Skav216394  [mRNA]  locus=scaffold457:187701:188795:+ [translate_table: standard]